MTAPTIDLALDTDFEWCAQLMSTNDPWLTLGRDFETCLVRCRGPEFVVLLARNGEQRAGFLLLHPTGVAGSPYIAAIAVSAAARGQGVGSALLAAAERWFPAARHIFLCVSSFNTRAKKLYELRGYVQVGELPDYVIAGASEFIMHKRLERP
ncbi:GNAT family N-acetyltransferase [Paludibaculum fermentans]|uniref:GNAT family N-acetyltransferase n=1 Tax=Paludibaculum fermentans TaxID=1473598 RepID=UPI003EBF6914